MDNSNRVLLFILTTAVIVLTAAVICISVVPTAEDRFTEFYLLNRDGKASDYPVDLAPGQPADVILGIVNHEGTSADYSIQVTANDAIINTIKTGTVLNGQKWERSMDISIDNITGSQTIKFFLYMNNDLSPHIKNPLVLHTNIMISK